MAFVISEHDIFKHLIYREDGERTRVKDNVRWFMTRVEINIFRDEFYILYKAIQSLQKYDSMLTYPLLEQILLNNINSYLNSKQVQLYNHSDLSSLERGTSIVNYVLEVYETLLDMDIEDDELQANTEFYVDTYVRELYTEVIATQTEIMNDGKQIGRDFYHGVTGAISYMNKANGVISTLADGDKSLISDRIDTRRQSYEEINQLEEEAESGGVVLNTGIEELDAHYEIHKGEMVTIQAGSGVGKTRAAVGLFTYNSLVELGSTVLVLTLEQKSTRILQMYYSRHILEKYGDLGAVTDKTLIRKSYPMELQPQVEEGKRDFISNPEYGRLVIDSVNLYANDMKAHLDEIWDSGVHFDAIVLDYIGLLQTQRSRYEELTDVVNMLKSECKSYKGVGFGLVVINQLTKEGEEKLMEGNYEEASKLAGSETQYITRASDFVFTLHQSLAMRRLNRLYLIPSKVRLGDPVVDKHELIADLGTCSYMVAD